MADFNLEAIREEFEREFAATLAELDDLGPARPLRYAKFDFTPRNSFELEVFRDEGFEYLL